MEKKKKFNQNNAQVIEWKKKLHTIIFEADTPGGKLFDILLLISILASVTAVLLESISSVREEYGNLLLSIEWFFTILFTIEFILRTISVAKPFRYFLSFLGMIDFLSIIPTYLSLFIPGSQTLIVIRVLRLLRVFRIFKLVHFLGEAGVLIRALKASKIKIAVFIITVLCITVITGTIMYLVEGAESGFTSIPKSIYWSIVTLTTVGYGDIAPQTPLGQMLASLIMILGYGIIAVPTGIVTTEIAIASRKAVTSQACPHCAREGHDVDAVFCKFCGWKL